eukprot:Clim_evm113s157 gene=Clim_evmTU113s157
MAESIVIQVGQCGNQIGGRFWSLALQEQLHYSEKEYDSATSVFFRQEAVSDGPAPVITPENRNAYSETLRARAVLIDMEEGVVQQLMKGKERHLFDTRQKITDVSGAGNNWAAGYHMYGQQYKEAIVDNIRYEAEKCDCLQSFFILHSLGGGTGSGVGSYVYELVADEFEDATRFAVPVFPSRAHDDVVTSPYNALLSCSALVDHADCIIPIDNQSLGRIYDDIARYKLKSKGHSFATAETADPNVSDTARKAQAFDSMNNIVANVMLSMTASARFSGSMNVDMNEIQMNLVPFPKQHFLVSGLAPLYSAADVNIPVRRLDQMFTDAFSKDNLLVDCNLRAGSTIASAFMIRGDVELSDVRRNIDRLIAKATFVDWNRDAWKVGLCSKAPVSLPHSLLALHNNSAVTSLLCAMDEHFYKIYKRKAHVHHYTKFGLELSDFDAARQNLDDVVQLYNQSLRPTQPHPRFSLLSHCR